AAGGSGAQVLAGRGRAGHGAGAVLPGSSGAGGFGRAALCVGLAESGAGGRDGIAVVQRDPREAGFGLYDWFLIPPVPIGRVSGDLWGNDGGEHGGGHWAVP